jgi:hypothetical protein
VRDVRCGFAGCDEVRGPTMRSWILLNGMSNQRR